MASDIWGLVTGEPVIVQAKVDASTSAITQFDYLAMGTAGYVQKAVAGSTIVGVAMESCGVPGADGNITIKMDVSEETVYRRPVGNGMLTQAMCYTTCDIYTSRSIDVAASTDDCVLIVECDVANQIALVQNRYTRAGTV